MITSREVFAKRKEGAIDEAYKMALKLLENPEKDEWDLKAIGWCIIDLIKREAKSGNKEKLALYAKQLTELAVDPADKVLTEQKEYALRLCNPNGQRLLEAKALSKEGNHQKALSKYKEIYRNGDTSQDVQTGIAWELYRVAKSFIEQPPVNFDEAKRCLNDYFQLETEKPSLLHSCFLQIADKIASEGKLKMGAFAKIWKLDLLRPEDYKRFKAESGEFFPSLAEKVIQHACKDSFAREAQDELAYILPFIDDCIERSPENLWLIYSKTKALTGTGQNDRALPLALQVTKNKMDNFWAWDLLGDIYLSNSPDHALACYCKALECESDINFISKVKIKLAILLIEKDCFDQAKLEIEEIVKYRVEHNQNIPDQAKKIISFSWYSEQKTAKSNSEFYRRNANIAEELLYADAPWLLGVLGKTFTSKSHPNKTRREIYVSSNESPLAVSYPESKIKLSKKQPGIGIKMQGEKNLEGRFQIYALAPRDSDEKWDIFEEVIGVVDHINDEKKLIHFIVNKEIDGVIHFSDLESDFKVGDAIAVKVSRHSDSRGTIYRALTSSETDKAIPENLIKPFESSVTEDRGMGFTDDGIFIAPPMMEAYKIEDQDIVTGKAILNYNKKQSKWGWKALSIYVVD